MLAALALAVSTAAAEPALPANRDLGLEVARLTPNLRRFLESPDGVLVWSVVPGSPAEAAGFERGDVLVWVGDVEARSPLQVSWTIAGARGAPLELVVARGGVEAAYAVDVPARRRGRGPATPAAPATDAPADDQMAAMQARIDELERRLAAE